MVQCRLPLALGHHSLTISEPAEAPFPQCFLNKHLCNVTREQMQELDEEVSDSLATLAGPPAAS